MLGWGKVLFSPMLPFHANLRMSRRVTLGLYIISILSSLIGIKLPIEDSFHSGEWFAASTTLWNHPESPPVTIHGAWDFLPALALRWLAGEDKYYYPTIYFVQAILPALAGAVFLLLLYKLLRGREGWAATVFLGVVAVSTPSIIGIRDLFLLATIYCLRELLLSESKALQLQSLLLLMMTSSVGLVWSFDRGIAGLITVIVALVSAAYLGKKSTYIHACAWILAAAFAVLVLGRVSGTIDYLYNVDLLAKTSSQWRYPLSLSTGANMVMAILFVCSIIVATAQRNASSSAALYYPFWLGCACCSLILLRFGINRADILHIYWTMWAPLILLAHSSSFQKKWAQKPSVIVVFVLAIMIASMAAYYIYINGTLLVAGLVLAVCLLWADAHSISFKVRAALASLSIWLLILSTLDMTRSVFAASEGVLKGTVITPVEYFATGIPYARFADPDNAWAARMIKESGSKCLLDMTNSGIINAGVDLPTCLQVSYPVYATSRFEDQLLKQAQGMDAQAIVYSTTNWQYAIDGKSMRQRLPRLDAFLRQRYPVEECHGRYCIRRREPGI